MRMTGVLGVVVVGVDDAVVIDAVVVVDGAGDEAELVDAIDVDRDVLILGSRVRMELRS